MTLKAYQNAMDEVKQLRAEKEFLQGKLDYAHEVIVQRNVEITRLGAKLEAAKAEILRYRWLRDNATQQADSLGPIFRIDVRRTSNNTLFNIDAAIDKARSEK